MDESVVTPPPQSVDLLATDVIGEKATIQQLLLWLKLPNIREQRRYLEGHYDSLNALHKSLLHALIAQKPEGSKQRQQFHEALLLLEDAQRRGGTTEAIREAFVNLYSGFALVLPLWLEELEQRLTDLRNQNRPEETAEIREAGDPADFLINSLDSSTILSSVEQVGQKHALIYLAATPWGGIAGAALGTGYCDVVPDRFATFDLPELTDELMKTLVERRIGDGTNCLIGGFALAQIGAGFEQILQDWHGETFLEKAEALHAACQNQQRSSTLDTAVQDALTRSWFTTLAQRPLDSLSQKERSLLDETIAEILLQQELRRCLDILGATALQATINWIQEQGATSLTLIPCGYLAAFPLTSIILSDDRLVTETVITSVAPSARSLLRNWSRPSASVRNGVFTLGDPKRDLPWSEAEALTLAKLARRHQLSAEVQVKEQATRAWLLNALQRGQVVDASCHGSFNPHDILRSSLRLANRERITMGEMISHQADLRGLRLLILSACQTAIVDLEGARDEVHNMAAAMLQSGAQAVLASPGV